MTALGNIAGAVFCLPTNFVSGVGVAGADGTAQTIKTIVMPKNTLTQLGDRIRIRCYWKGDTGTAITGTLKLNGVTVGTKTDSGAASFEVNEAWLHYIDATHANIIESGDPPGAASDNNVAGFNWAASQNVEISQDNIGNNHIVVFFLCVDVFPLGVI